MVNVFRLSYVMVKLWWMWSVTKFFIICVNGEDVSIFFRVCHPNVAYMNLVDLLIVIMLPAMGLMLAMGIMTLIVLLYLVVKVVLVLLQGCMKVHFPFVLNTQIFLSGYIRLFFF